MRRDIAVSARITLSALLCAALAVVGCSGESGNSGALATLAQPASAGRPAFDPPEVTNGERLFLETRFAQFFKAYLDAGGTVNATLPAGDPVMNLTVTTRSGLPGPFAGLSMNCRACHLVDEHVGTPGGSMRTYGDFARRSPIPARVEDGHITAPRNSPPLVNASLARTGGTLFHFDGEFSTMTGLTAATFTGRNFGWVPGERTQAIAHVARIVREDDGTGALAQEFGGLPLGVMLTGSGQAIPKEFRIPPAFRINVARATDQEIFDGIVRLVSAYVEQLVFSQDDTGAFNLSPFDVFLTRNGLPRKPAASESPLDYSRRLRGLLAARQQAGTLIFVSNNPITTDGRFQFHDQEFRFGPEELAGLMIFLAEPTALPPTQTNLPAGGIGNCVACHAAPNFTDFNLHNTGTAQREYDEIHGAGQFAQLSIPNLTERNAHPERYLPATHTHPLYEEPFRAVPSAINPNLTDLGVWNIFANPDMPEPQETIRAMLCNGQQPCPLSDDILLDLAIARVKTPGLRDLGHGAPYMHNGQFNGLDDIARFYRDVSEQARAGTLRNGAPQLQGIALTAGDLSPLVAFLKSLNEDYE
jgi:cytochrome c peroxidase